MPLNCGKHLTLWHAHFWRSTNKPNKTIAVAFKHQKNSRQLGISFSMFFPKTNYEIIIDTTGHRWPRLDKTYWFGRWIPTFLTIRRCAVVASGQGAWCWLRRPHALQKCHVSSSKKKKTPENWLLSDWFLLANWATFKTLVTFHCTHWFIGILWMACNPYATSVV